MERLSDSEGRGVTVESIKMAEMAFGNIIIAVALSYDVYICDRRYRSGNPVLERRHDRHIVFTVSDKDLSGLLADKTFI